MDPSFDVESFSWRADGASAGVLVGADGRPRARYNWGPEANNPYFHPVYARGDEAPLTVQAPADHRWHRGLWWSWKFVNEYLFWEDHPDHGGVNRGLGRTVVRRHSAEEVDGRVRIEQELEVRIPERVLLDEERQLTIHADTGVEGGWAIDWKLRWTARVDCEMRVTEDESWGGYAGLSFRAARSLALEERILADGGRVGLSAVHGAPSRWVALSGDLDGSAESDPDAPAKGGIALLAHPGNARFPTPAYVTSAAGEDGFGFAALSPIFHERLALDAGEELALDFRALVFAGGADPELLQRAWLAYAAS